MLLLVPVNDCLPFCNLLEHFWIDFFHFCVGVGAISLSYNIVNFSLFFFVLAFDDVNVPPSDAVYITTWLFVALPSLLLLFCSLFCYKFLTSSLFHFIILFFQKAPTKPLPSLWLGHQQKR